MPLERPAPLSANQKVGAIVEFYVWFKLMKVADNRWGSVHGSLPRSASRVEDAAGRPLALFERPGKNSAAGALRVS